MSGPGQAAQDATRALVRCDGAIVPVELLRQSWDHDVRLQTDGEAPSLNLRIEELTGKIVGALDARAADLVRIAAFAYGADRAISRGGIDVHREKWRRRMSLCVEVSDPDFWSSTETVAALGAALYVGTEDHWSFHFTQRPPATQQLRLEVGGQPMADRELMGEPDSVMLMSGGIDSLCALVEAVTDHGLRPVVVSHRSTPVVDGLQTDLLTALRERFHGWPLPPMSFWIHRKGSDARDESQRTRGFLFASLGLAVAGQLGLPRVLLPDNGYVSLNPAYNAQLVGALNSRGTHPTFLRLMNELAALVFPGNVRVENPLVDRTRAEALEILKTHGVQELVGLTRSCGKPRRPKEVPHCGGCSQCVDRRFAVVTAGLEEHDPPSRYGVDIFRGPLTGDEAPAVATSFVRFAKETVALSADDLYAEHEELIGALDAMAPDFNKQATGLANVLTKHANEVMRVMGIMFGRYGEDLTRGALASPNLLALVARDLPGTSAALTEPTRNAVDPDNGIGAPHHRMDRHKSWWHIVFRGERGIVKHSVGIHRLARLVKAGKAGMLAYDLVSGSSPSGDAPGDRSDEEDEQQGAGGRDDGLRAQEPERRRRSGFRVGATREEREARARELEEQLQCDELSEAKRERIVAELEAIAARTMAEGGRSDIATSPNDAFEKARTTLWHSIVKVAYRDIDSELPNLRAHFTESVHLGLRCHYDPNPPEHWVIDLGNQPSR